MDGDRCIACGACFDVCEHGAKLIYWIKMSLSSYLKNSIKTLRRKGKLTAVHVAIGKLINLAEEDFTVLNTSITEMVNGNNTTAQEIEALAILIDEATIKLKDKFKQFNIYINFL